MSCWRHMLGYLPVVRLDDRAGHGEIRGSMPPTPESRVKTYRCLRRRLDVLSSAPGRGDARPEVGEFDSVEERHGVDAFPVLHLHVPGVGVLVGIAIERGAGTV